MSDVTRLLGEHVGRLTVAFERETDFGLSVADILSGKPIPATGARIDIDLTGTMTGALAGTVRGTDHLDFAPGLAQLVRHLHLVFHTDAGGRVAASGEGVVTPTAEVPITSVRVALRCRSLTPPTRWIDGQTVWAVGEVDPLGGTVAGEVHLVEGRVPLL